MKWLKPHFSFTLLIVVLSAGIVRGQEKMMVTCEKSFSTANLKAFSLKTYDSDVKINTWDSPTVKIKGEMIVSNGGNDHDDVAILKEVFQNTETSQRGGVLEVNTSMVESNSSVAGVYSRTTLKGGKTITNVTFRTSYEIWMPADLPLALKSKYNKAEVGDLKAPVDFDLYNVRLTQGSFADGSRFRLKYSKASLGMGGDCTFDSYDSDVTGSSVGNIDVVGKYSSFGFTSILDFQIDSYDDDFSFQSARSVKGKAKYSSLKATGSIGFANLNLYDSDLVAASCGTFQLDGKYCKVTIDELTALVVSNSYDSKLTIGTVKSVTALSSKYDKYQFATVQESLIFSDAYSTEIDAQAIGKAFLRMKGKFKYGKVKIGLPPTFDYSLHYETTYGKVNFDRERFKHTRISDVQSSKSMFTGATKDDPACSISFTAYDTTVDLGN